MTKRSKNDAEQHRAKNGCIKRKTSVSKQNRSDFVSLRGLCKNGTLILIESAFIQPRTLVSHIKTFHFRVIARPQRGRGNLKVEGMESRGEAREHEARRNTHNGSRKTGNTAQSAFSASFSDSGSFRFIMPRSGMPPRSVKDCRVGRTRPPRNDKTDRFVGKRSNFRSEKFRIRPGGAPPRCFSGSAISRGHKPAFHMRSIFHLLKEQISLRSHTRPKAEFHCAVRTVPCRVRRKERPPQIDFAATV